MDIKGRIAYSRYCKVKITENSRTEWDEITRVTVWKIDKKALRKSNSYFYNFFSDNCFTNIYPGNNGYIFEGTERVVKNKLYLLLVKIPNTQWNLLMSGELL